MAMTSVLPAGVLGIVTVCIVIFVIATTVYYALSGMQGQNKKLQQLPPRPPGVPLIGNMIEVLQATKKSEQHLLMEMWAREYGDIVRVDVGPFSEYFLNSDAAVKQIFDRLSSVSAERPRWIVSNEHICNQMNVLLLNASSHRWKHQRKVIMQGLTGIPKADAGLPYLHYETAKFLQEVVSTPSVGLSGTSLWKAIGRYTYSTFASQTFGMDISDSENPVIGYIYETGIAQILGTLPGYHIVDVLPVLDKLPLALKPWERNGKARYKRDLEWCMDRTARIKNNLHTGRFVQIEAFLPTVLQDEKLLGFDDEAEPSYLALQLIIGAADTSRISTWSFLEAMLTFPDMQEKAQHLIDQAVGDRLPVYEDLDKIPYVRCLMKETWRWRPPVALGHPHTTTRDIEYQGMTIPKGARLHLNAWAISRDPRRHEDPDRFWPERYENDGTNTMQSINATDVTQRDHFAFGSGRRVCPGYHVAERSLAVSIMRLLWAFNIKPATTEPLDPNKFRGDMPGNAGEEMPVTLRVRSEERKAIILQTFQELDAQRAPLEPLA